jgi:alpha-1,2-mannosyltransferase
VAQLKPVSWLTAKRLRAHGLILALSLWSVYVWNITTPGLRDRSGNLKGTDFLHLYVLGSLADGHRGADLYNMEAQSAFAAQRVSEAAGIRYLPLYPPQVSIFFAPLERFSYAGALILWLAATTLIYGCCCYAMWRVCQNLHEYKLEVIILALAFPAFWHLIAWGQTSALALAFFTLAFFALRARREFLAGLALGCLTFKPQLAVATAIIFLFSFQWKILAGAILAAAAQLSAACFYYGFGPLRDWTRTLFNLPAVLPLLEPKIYQTHSLRTFWTILLPWLPASIILYIVSAVLVSWLTVVCWKSKLPLSLRYSALLLSSVLLAPHLTVYDLVILAPVFLLLSAWILANTSTTTASPLAILLYLAFVLPLIGPLAQWTHFQLSVPVIAALLYEIWRISRTEVMILNFR